MIINEEDALSRINSPNNLANKLTEIRELHSGRTGPKNIPPMVQELIGVTAAMTTQRAAAESFGVARSTAGLYERGETKNSLGVRARLDSLHSEAIDAMFDSIAKTKELIPNVKKATDASTIAANMSRVIEKTSPKEANTTNVKVVVYAPRQQSEQEYETVEVA